jgi:hypothetical protein
MSSSSGQAVVERGATRPRSFRLRYRNDEIPLPLGTFVIGRSPDAGLVIDDTSVSRLHAQLVVGESSAYVEDLGSSNGIYVNGVRVLRRRDLEHRDHIMLGDQEMWVVAMAASGFAPALKSVTHQQPFAHATDEDTHQFGDLTLRAQMAEKVIAQRQGEEAERLVSTKLSEVLEQARQAGRIDADRARRAARLAGKLAAARRKGEWFDFIVDLYSVEPLPMSSEFVEELFLVLREVPCVDLDRLASYVQALGRRRGRLDADQLTALDHLMMLSHFASLK